MTGWNVLDCLSLPDRADRQGALDAVARDSVAANQSGMRVGKSGRRCLIENATVWTRVDADGVRYGQAAVFEPPSATM